MGVWKIVLRTDTSGGASGRAQIRYVTKLAGSRASVTSGGFSPTVHNSLSGRSDVEAHPAPSITNIPAGNIAALTLQGAINELDSEKGGLSLNNSWTGSNTFTVLRINLVGASEITSYLTTGASDGNFRLISSNGSGTTTNSEQAWLGLAYSGTRLAGISFVRGGDADGSLQFTTNNNTVALTLGMNGSATFSSSISAPSATIGGRIHISDNDIEERGTNAESGLAFNYSGYNGGTTQFRNFDVYDGKNGLILNITGSTKAATFEGNLSSYGVLS